MFSYSTRQIHRHTGVIEVTTDMTDKGGSEIQLAELSARMATGNASPVPGAPSYFKGLRLEIREEEGGSMQEKVRREVIRIFH